MRYTGVLPVARRSDGSIVFLLGRENDGPDAGNWSDFGGGPHDPTNAAKSAADEAYEESMAVLGTSADIERILLNPKRSRRFDVPGGVMFLMQIDFDNRLPTYWNRMADYSKRCVKRCPEGFFEKDMIGWFTTTDLPLIRLRPAFRRSLSVILRHPLFSANR